MKKFLIASLLCAAMTAAMVPAAFAADTNYTRCMVAINQHRTVQADSHRRADALRAKGYTDNSNYIQAEKAAWYHAAAAIEDYTNLARYTDEDIRIMTTTVYHEAGQTTEKLRQYVAGVALNRVADNRFPDTVKGVITQPGQYAVKYADPGTTQAIRNQDAQRGTHYYAICEDSVKQVMMGNLDMPSNVIYQANFTQGSGIWETVHFDSGYFASTSYFCYG